MGKCLDRDNCGLENRDNALFCARCGIPLRGTFLHGRYEIQKLSGRDHETVTMQAIDRHYNRLVTVRALVPLETNDRQREDFLQEAELAASLSSHVNEPGSIYVTDYGQDGPLTFLVKSTFNAASNSQYPPPARGGQQAQSPITRNLATRPDEMDDEDGATMLRLAVPPSIHITGNDRPAVNAARPRQKDWLTEGNLAYERGNYKEALQAYEMT